MSECKHIYYHNTKQYKSGEKCKNKIHPKSENEYCYKHTSQMKKHNLRREKVVEEKKDTPNFIQLENTS